jgi:hypothetical protein
MASTIIHLAIAKKVQEKIRIENLKDYYLGAIAPDISKQIGESREASHFLINTKEDIPNINVFVKRYPLFQYNSFDTGYFTHLYTDKVWNESFLPNFIKDNSIKLVDGKEVKVTKEEAKNMLYSDYTNLNVRLIDEYGIDLSLFYDEFIPPKTNIKEIPVNQLDILLNKISIILENSKSEKTYTLDFASIKSFINETAKQIIEEIKKY